MSGNVEIRPYREGDLAALHEITIESFDGVSIDQMLSISNIGTDRDPRELLLRRAGAEFSGNLVVASAPIDRP